MEKIIGIGNALVDVSATIKDDALLPGIGLTKGSMQLINADEYAKLSVIMTSMPLTRTTGGSASNTLLALGHLGASPAFIGKVGTDENGTFYAQSIESFGVRALLAADNRFRTGVASTFISPDGERTFGTFLGAAAQMTASDVTEDMLKGYTYLYIEGYLVQNHELIEHVAKTAHNMGLKIGLDLASFNIVAADRNFFRHLLTNYVDIVFANEEESRAYAGSDPETALNLLAETCETAVVKLGAKGVIVRQGDETVQVAALDVPKVTDTTAAGDYFAGGFLYGKACGCSLKVCAEIGSLLSGHIIQTIGTALSESTWEYLRTETARLMMQEH